MTAPHCTTEPSVGNATVVTVEGLYDQHAAAYLNSATLTMTLTDPDGEEVADCVGVPLTYVAGSSGNYRGLLPAVEATPNKPYRLRVSGTAIGYRVDRTILFRTRTE